MSNNQNSLDPLHGVTLEMLLNELVHQYGWEVLARKVAIRCFNSNPTMKSSLKFLRRTPWARDKVESLYLEHKMEMAAAGILSAASQAPVISRDA